MAKLDKILEKMRKNPLNWRIEQVEIIARSYQIAIRKTGGSHVVLDHPDLVELFTIPAHKPIKPVYIKKFVKLIELLQDNNENN